MTHPNKAKGNAYEEEVVRAVKSHGLSAQRAWGSDGRAMGEHQEVDLKIEGFKIQAKRYKRIAQHLIPSNQVDAVVTRPDRGQSLVILRLEDFLELLIKLPPEDRR